MNAIRMETSDPSSAELTANIACYIWTKIMNKPIPDFVIISIKPKKKKYTAKEIIFQIQK